MTGIGSSRKAILFDLDDTLINTCAASFEACVASAASLGLDPPDRHRFLQMYGNAPFRSCFKTWFGTSKGFREFAAAYHRNVLYSPIGDIQGMLLSLHDRGVLLGVVTNSLQGEAENKIRSADIPERILSFVVGRPPGSLDEFAPKSLGEILEKYTISAGFATYISDNPLDAVAARHAGLAFKGVLTGVYGEDDFRAFDVPPQYVYCNVHSAVG